ncbi:hypothetical protein DFA_10807 [Cavenderia fasciculata]|uniref:Uncharacterized protein n=1 Tax=Cavenderia fasciculata TaxID=261658 RepID=F4QBG1_CACFS|nr:uncharacterized protein DFA_10807 [Cavenderia fasciculata]EGG14933.1 hypothetical protein DFA_10807 [Cavenderia fasciculata]|eukprot:XP_004351449.1 hypothetical protein DFA_10807 [Cavenderia fasciculata]
MNSNLLAYSSQTIVSSLPSIPSSSSIPLNNNKQQKEKEKEKKKKKKNVLLSDLIYLIIFIPICYLCYYLPSFYIESFDYLFDTSKYVLWISSIIIGYTYVNLVTESRDYPFYCRNKTHRDFIQLLIILTLMYFIAPSKALMGNSNGDSTTTTTTTTTANQTFIYNYVTYFIPYFIAIHFTYLDHNLLVLRKAGHKLGTPSLWKTYNFQEIIAIVPMILLVLSLLTWHLYLIAINGLWKYYLIVYGTVLSIVLTINYILAKTHYLHIHHYIIFGSLIPFTAFNNALSSFCLGVATGITVEGVSRWSMAKLWYPGIRTFK